MRTGGQKIWRPGVISEPFCTHGQRSRKALIEKLRQAAIRCESLCPCIFFLVHLRTSDDRAPASFFFVVFFDLSLVRSAASGWDVGFVKWFRVGFAAEGLKKFFDTFRTFSNEIFNQGGTNLDFQMDAPAFTS